MPYHTVVINFVHYRVQVWYKFLLEPGREITKNIWQYLHRTCTRLRNWYRELSVLWPFAVSEFGDVSVLSVWPDRCVVY